MSDYPKTKDEWWSSVDDNWQNLLGILRCFIGMADHENIDGKIIEGTRAEEINQMKEKRDSRLVRYFNAAWLNAPDVAGLWEIKGWNEMCDLCSEEYVLHEKEKNHDLP